MQVNIETQDIPVFNALAVTDTVAKVSGTIDCSKALKKCLKVASTLNQQVSINVQVNIGGTWTIAGGAATTVAGPGNSVLTETEIKFLGQPVRELRVTATCAVAPTSGSLTVIMGAN